MGKIIVFGSISTDFVVESDRLPQVGETIHGETFQLSFGGKGANQAVACARLGAETIFVGAVGDDLFAKSLLDNLKENQIVTQFVSSISDTPSGAAMINIIDKDNSIIYVAGANNRYQFNSTKALCEELDDCDLVVLQNEILLEENKKIINYCHAHQIPVLYNPAPAIAIEQELLDKVTYITPNETEFEVIFGGQDVESVLAKYPNKLIVTLGSKGVMYHDGKQKVIVPAYNVKNIVDTTGAGDTFNGAFAVAISQGLTMSESLKFGNLASSLSIQKFGAQGGMPTINDIKRDKNYEIEWDFK